MTQNFVRYSPDLEQEEPDFERSLQTVLDDMKQHMRGSLKTEGIAEFATHFDQGAHMSTIHFKQTTTATPEQFIAGLTDFGPGRGKLFGNSTDQYLKVHEKGSNYADVTEGSSGIWERLRYDWSDPKHVVLTTTDSNLWGGRSGHTYTFTRQPNGTTDVDVVIVRDGKNFKGRVLGAFLGIVGKGQLEKWFAKTLKAIEARNYEISAAAKA